MSDTIELLEAIGRDASLRHASSEELADVLHKARASEALTAAVASGDSSLLAEELGHKVNLEPQAVQHPGYDEDEPGNGTSEESDAPSTTDDGNPPAAESAR
jgi:hypothetical protein